MQKEDEVEVVHLEWERVEDPNRKPQPDPEASAIREILNRPNPLREPSGETAFWIVWIAMAVVVAVARWLAQA